MTRTGVDEQRGDTSSGSAGGGGPPTPGGTSRPPPAMAPGRAVGARPPQRHGMGPFLRALLFLLPALLLLGALVVYPIVYSVIRSLYGRSGSEFVGLDNYQRTFESSATLHALRNTLIWVVVAPALATAIGLVFAVLSERVRWQTAFKVAVFMPMAISFLAAGVIFRFVYEQDPQRGIANAVVTSVEDVIRPPGDYPGARPSEPDSLPCGRWRLPHHGHVFAGSGGHARPRGDPARRGATRCRPRPPPVVGSVADARRRGLARLHPGVAAVSGVPSTPPSRGSRT